MNKIIYREADLDYIFVRTKLSNESYGSLSLNEFSDKQFTDWAKRKFGIEVKDDIDAKNTPWTPQQKVQFINDISDRLGQPAVFMIKEETRHEWDRENSK